MGGLETSLLGNYGAPRGWMATKLLQPGFPSGPSNCYTLVTPLDTPIRAILCIKEGENVRLCAKALQRGKIITFGKHYSHK